VTVSVAGMSSTVAVTDVVRQRELRRMKVFATGLLVAAAAVFVVARANEGGPAWVGYVEAFAEAAMVGALADWFAVTALFRYPLGVPIPHTAIIPKRKDQIGRSLGEFVQNHFLTKEVLTERLHGAHIGRRLGLWLREPENAERAAAAIADAARGTIEVLDDRDVQDAIGGLVQRRLEQTPVAPLVGKAIDVAVEGGHHQRLLDAVLTGLSSFLDDNRATLRSRLEQESPWWIPEPVDDRIFRKIFTGVRTTSSGRRSTNASASSPSGCAATRCCWPRVRRSSGTCSPTATFRRGCSRCGASSSRRCSMQQGIRRASCAAAS
jgi:uncharacterized membrane-anchored protein YjiN (DUF445 family)